MLSTKGKFYVNVGVEVGHMFGWFKKQLLPKVILVIDNYPKPCVLKVALIYYRVAALRNHIFHDNHLAIIII